MVYNHALKVYPDGTIQHLFYKYPICKFDDYISPLDFIDDDVLCNKNGDSVLRGEKYNVKHARQMVYDICRSNDWNWFVTLTLDPSKCDSYDFDSSYREVKKFLKWCTINGLKYIMVTEMHKSGRYHFHGLIHGSLDTIQAFYPDGNIIDGIFNIPSYKGGFATASIIRDSVRASSYLVKYLTKDMCVPKGRKRYWCSCGLNRPCVLYDDDIVDDNYIESILENADFSRISESEYQVLTLAEYHSK